MNMNTRIKEVRKKENLSMEQFAKRIGVTRSSISRIESGENNPSEQTIMLICKEFSINEKWLRTGKGEIKKTLTENQEIDSFMNDIMSDIDETFRKRLILALSKLNKDEWKMLEKIANELLKKEKPIKSTEQTILDKPLSPESEQEINERVAIYRNYLENKEKVMGKSSS